MEPASWRPRRTGALAALVIGVLVFAATVTWTSTGRGDRARADAFAAVHVQRDLLHLGAIEDRGAEHGWDAADSAEARALSRSAARRVDRLRSRDDAPRPVVAGMDEYLARHDELVALVDGRDLAAAAALEDETLDPLASSLVDDTDAFVDDAARRAAHADGLARGGALLATVIAVVVIGALWITEHRRQGRASATAIRDVEQRARAASDRHNELLAREAPDVVLLTTLGGTVRYASPSVQGVLGVAPDTLVGHRLELFGDHDPSPADHAAAAPAGVVRLERDASHADGTVRHMDVTVRAVDDDVAGCVLLWTARDVTTRRALEAELERRALHDDLTGLPNRIHLLATLGEVVEGPRPDGTLLLLDLDGFKVVNDTAGHSAGDELLVEAAARLSACVREHDTVARLGGDEFAIVLPGIDHARGRAVAVRVVEELQRPIVAQGVPWRMSASIGITTIRPSATAEDLLREADLAMYSAKNTGRGAIETFRADGAEASDRPLVLLRDLPRAVSEGQLVVHYQPIIHLRRAQIYGLEALVRWQHPELGLLPPSAFIGAAERTGDIRAIGRAVFEESCRQAAAWDRELGRPLLVAVNMSAQDLASADFIPHVEHTLATHDLGRSHVSVEITESALIDIDRALPKLHRLRELGVSVAIDDFGTGYSSLSYLRRLPAGVLKIDRQFLADVEQPSARNLLEGIVSMGQALGMRTVIEGVETAAQLRLATDMGIVYAQGYLWSRPVPAEDVPALMARLVPVVEGAAMTVRS